MKFCFILILLSNLCFSAEYYHATRSEIERTSLLFFRENSHPETGLVRDRASNFAPTPESNTMSSLAATGFGLTVVGHASTRNLVSREYAKNYVRKILRFTLNAVPHYKGWLAHFVHWKSGVLTHGSEFSTIDTALFVAGALYAAQILKDPEIEDLAYRIYDRVDFHSALTDDGKNPSKKTISLSYTPEKGWTTYQWSIYSEQKILLLLGLAHPSKPIPRSTWFAWSRALNGQHMPLFIHQYSLAFFDFRNFQDGFNNYFKTSLSATYLHRNLSKHGFWGLSAGEDPEGYKVYSPVNNNGTFCIGCSLASAMFAPEVVMKDANSWINGKYRSKIWGKYGLTDSVNIDKSWFSPYVLGITVGPAYMSLNNMEGKTSIWRDFMKVPAMKKAIEVIKGK